MTPITQDTQPVRPSQADLQALLHEKMRSAIRVLFVQLLEEEVTAFVGASEYQRTPGRRDQRNGTYTRALETTVGRLEALPVPRTRKGFKSQLFERYHRRQATLDTWIADMFVAGASTLQVGALVETLTGTKPSPSTVSRVFHSLEDEFTAWKTRPLAEQYAYLFVDGTYFTVIYNGEGVKMPIIAAVGIRPSGEREVLAFSTGEHENQKAWEDLFDDLKRRGVKEVGLCISDGGAAPLAALAVKFAQTQRQRCIWHKMENILSYIPKSQQAQVEPELKAIFYQESRTQADQLAAAFREKYADVYPTALECMARDWEACLTFYAFPRAHWKTIRTNNVMERLFNEVKKRYHKMAAAFRGETSCLLMFFAVIRSMKFRKISMPAK
jgi:transposase-like protein